jgi:hypothetical protein
MATEQEIQRLLMKLKEIGAAVAVILAAVELTMANSHRLSTLEAGILTPLAVISFIAPIFIENPRPHGGSHWVQSDYKKIALMLLGAIIAMLGGALFFSSVGRSLEVVAVETGAGTGMIGSGIYIVRRFNW